MALLIDQAGVSVPCVAEIVVGAGLSLAALGPHRAGLTAVGTVPGPAGPSGPRGARGPAGAQGPPGLGPGTPAGGDLAGTYPDPEVGRVTVALTNRSGAGIPAGTPVTTNAPGTGVVPADASAAGVAFGLAEATSADLAPARVLTAGTLSLPDWTAPAGAPSLAPGTSYFLGPAGTLVVVPPSGPGQVVQYLGRAVGPQAFEFQPGDPVRL